MKDTLPSDEIYDGQINRASTLVNELFVKSAVQYRPTERAGQLVVSHLNF